MTHVVAGAARIAAVVRSAAYSGIAASRRTGLRVGALQPRRPRAARQGRRHPRDQSVTRLAVFVATVAYCGYFPSRRERSDRPPAWSSTLLVWWIALTRGRDRPDPRCSSRPVCGPASAAERHFGGIDPGPVVIDEVVGMLITLAFIPAGPAGALPGSSSSGSSTSSSRIPADRLEQLHGGLGVMADDAMAAVYANLSLRWRDVALPGWLDMTVDRPLRTAEVIAVGSELLGSTRLDTNSLFLSETTGVARHRAARQVRRRRRPRGSRRDLPAGARSRRTSSSSPADSGPTDDDVTRDVVASVLELPLYRRRSRSWPGSNSASAAAECRCPR